MSENQAAITVDLGGTNLRVALVANNQVVKRIMHPTPRGAEEIVGLISKQALEFTDQGVIGIAIAAPGTASPQMDRLSKAPNLPELNNYPMAAEITRQTKLPCIIENDANVYAMGETFFGAAVGLHTVVVYTLGTGVGGGIILSGKLWRGVNGAAAEIGHISIDEDGHLCGCGARGCLETYASATAMARLAKEYGSEANTAKKAFELAHEGDEGAQRAFVRAGSALGIAIAGMLNTLNPQAVVIGGGGSSAYPLLEPEIEKQLKVRAFPAALENFKLPKCTLGNDAALLGGAALLKEALQ
ncbi:MAG: ROK family protein [Blastocatellia bacterium]|nr:ROK family protein [Blastocatellia bacterium]